MLRTATLSPGTFAVETGRLATLLSQNCITICAALNRKCAAAHFKFNAENIFMRALIAESPIVPLIWMLLSAHKSRGCQGCDQLVAGTKAA